MFPFEFRGEVRHGKTRVMGLTCGVSFMILASDVFVQSTRVTDVQTSRRPDRIAITYIRAIAYMLSRAKTLYLMISMCLSEREKYQSVLLHGRPQSYHAGSMSRVVVKDHAAAVWCHVWLQLSHDRECWSALCDCMAAEC